jgi:hypothetical protein
MAAHSTMRIVKKKDLVLVKVILLIVPPLSCGYLLGIISDTAHLQPKIIEDNMVRYS